MSMLKRIALIGLGVIGLALVGAGTLVFLNPALCKRLIAAYDTQAEKTETALFRWGELMSLSAEMKKQYGAKPEVTYETSNGDRTLNIAFSNDPLPAQTAIDGHAREIAAFAVGKTKKIGRASCR